MSTNYYLHTPDMAESAHIGKSVPSSFRWITDASEGRPWRDTEGLRQYLGRMAERNDRGWVADEYGAILTPLEMVKIIDKALTLADWTHEFS